MRVDECYQALRITLAVRPRNLSTQAGRSRERYRRAVLSAGSAALARAISVMTMVISVPLTFHYLHQELYALWVTIGSTIAMLGSADFGIGNGLLTAIAESDGKSDPEAAQEYFCSGLYLLTAVGLIIAVAAVLIYPFVPWSRIYNVRSSIAMRVAGPAAITLILCFAVNIPLGIIRQVQTGYQEGFTSNLWSAFGSLLGLCGVLISVFRHASLPALIFAVNIGPMLANLVNCWTWLRRRRWPPPSVQRVSSSAVRRLIQSGTLFFVLQLAVSVGYQSDTIVIAQILGVEKVTQYAITTRIFSIAPVLFSIATMAVWPAFSEAFAAHDFAWVHLAFSRVLRFSSLAGLAINVPLMVFGPRIVRLWIGNAVSPPLSLFLACGVWGIQSGLAAALSALLNGLNAMRVQALCAGLMAVSNLLCSIYLARHVGVAGVIYATIATHLIFVLIPCGLYAGRVLSRITTPTVEEPLSSATVTVI